MTTAGIPSISPPASPGASKSGFVRQLDEAFARATGATREVSLTLQLAGRSVRIVCAGDALVPFVRGALTPRLSANGEGTRELTLKIWDARTTGVVAPLPPGPPSTFGLRGEVLGYSAEPVFAACSHASGALSVLDTESATGYFWVRDARDIPMHELGAPLLPLFGWFFRARGTQLVHAAAVGCGGQAVLLAGPGGSGKSTTALACLAAGLDHVADDYALVTGVSSPVVHALYATAKLNADSLARLPRFAGAVLNPERDPEEKALLGLGPAAGIRQAENAALRAIVVPRVRPGAPALTPILAGEVLRALAPSSIFQMASAGAPTFASLGALVKAVPA
ncbi:MAG: hypothetical protein NEA02_04475, partial [Thermoanaerobaculia bacterium]|nr:hypothetical protein [Thermoanaerobaculia bacterium]